MLQEEYETHEIHNNVSPVLIFDVAIKEIMDDLPPSASNSVTAALQLVGWCGSSLQGITMLK